MSTKLIMNNKEYRILNNYSIKSSNNEVTFNGISIDFTGANSEDLPFKYQEVIILKENKKIFTGFVDTFKLSKLNTGNKNIELTLNLLSPLKLATKRCVNLIGTYNLSDAVRITLQPLINDGFSLKECNIEDTQITTSFIIETIENVMNTICNKKNLFWYIDENKNIKVNSIDYLFGQGTRKTITTETEKGLIELQPTISNNDYSNIINFKNVRMIYSNIREGREYNIIELNKVLKKGDTIQFNNPIIFDENLLRNRKEEFNNDTSYGSYYIIDLSITTSHSSKIISLYLDNDGKYTIHTYGTDISYSNNSGNEAGIVFQRDGFFSNLITGLKWNFDEDGTIVKLNSDTALRYTTMRFMHSNEIENLKGIISSTGEIEKTIDYEEKWITSNQLIEYARSLMIQNTNVINEVSLQFDVNPNLKIGDIIEIDRPNFFVKGKFAVKSINYTYYTELKQIWKIVVKNSDFVSSYIDLFRPASKQESEDTINTVVLSEFIEETMVEKHTLEDSEVAYSED